jgi:hypothetical protein
MIDRLKYNFDKAQALKEHPAIASDEWQQLEKEPPEERRARLYRSLMGQNYWPAIYYISVDRSFGHGCEKVQTGGKSCDRPP